MLYVYSTDDHQWKISGFPRGVGQVRSSRFVCCLAIQKSEKLVNTAAQWSDMSKKGVGYFWCRKSRQSAPSGRHCVHLTYRLALDGCEWSPSRSDYFTLPPPLLPLPKERTTNLYWKGNWVDPRACLDFEKRKNSCFCREWTAGSSRPWSCHYTLLQNREYELCGGCNLNRKVEVHIPASVFKYGRNRPSVEVDYGFRLVQSFSNIKVKFLS
jgi:hypothetical protein